MKLSGVEFSLIGMSEIEWSGVGVEMEWIWSRVRVELELSGIAWNRKLKGV